MSVSTPTLTTSSVACARAGLSGAAPTAASATIAAAATILRIMVSSLSFLCAATVPASPGRRHAFRGRAWQGRMRAGNVLRHRLFGGRDALYLVRLQARQYLAGEALDLVHEQFVRQAAAVQRQLHRVGAGAFGGLDDALGDLVGGAERHVLGLLLELRHRQVAEL